MGIDPITASLLAVTALGAGTTAYTSKRATDEAEGEAKRQQQLLADQKKEEERQATQASALLKKRRGAVKEGTGRADIATSPLGLTTPPQQTGKTLLGV